MVKTYENIDLFKVREEASKMRSEFISTLFVNMLACVITNLTFARIKHA